MHDVAKHDDSKAQYFWVWGALLVLTAVEVWLGYRQIFEPVRMLEVLLVLSVIKSALIIGYFMHLKFEKPIMRWMIVISVVGCFVIMYFFFFPDAGRGLRLGGKGRDEIYFGQNLNCGDARSGLHLHGSSVRPGLCDVQCERTQHAERRSAGVEPGGAGAVDSSGGVYVAGGWIGFPVWEEAGPGAGLGFV